MRHTGVDETLHQNTCCSRAAVALLRCCCNWSMYITRHCLGALSHLPEIPASQSRCVAVQFDPCNLIPSYAFKTLCILDTMRASQLPLSTLPTAQAPNLHGDQLATGSIERGQAYVQIWDADAATPGAWTLRSQVQVPSSVTQIAWAHPESGPLLAAATDKGQVVVIEAPRPLQGQQPGDGSAMVVSREEDGQEEEEAPEQEWRVMSELSTSSSGVSHLVFAPRQYGLLLTAGSQDGHVYIWEADRPLAPNSWTLQAQLQVSSARSGGSGGGCRGVAWRGFSPNTAPMLAAAGPQSADVWHYVSELMLWQRVASLKPSSTDTVTALHWAPTLGRPMDLIALAHGSSVDVFSLQGEAASPSVQRQATLPHSAPVWKVQFNQMGTCLAAATEDNQVTVWRPNFVGEWISMCVLAGSEEMAEEGGAA